MKKGFIAAALLFSFLINSACTSLGFQSESAVEILYSAPDRISFQGKGAGAGMALMSSMGPVGIALGVAIDEGIAKEIRETAQQGGVEFKALLNSAIADVGGLQQADRIEVKRYGFVIKDGSNDYVAAEIHLLVMQDGQTEDLILSSWDRQQAEELWITLNDVKTKADSILALFEMALK
jgi:hypothetical protein